nr:response regulator [uncultured Cohaesibacter sp.]
MIESKKTNEGHVLHKICRVLVADRSPIVRSAVRRGISVYKDKRYLDVIFVEDGIEALKIFQAKRVDVAFVDIDLPGLSGPKLVSELKTTLSDNCLTIAMSGEPDSTTEAVLEEFGAYHLLRKPFKAQDVADIFMTYLIMTNIYRILVVDDSSTMRKVARDILKRSRFRYEFTEADSALNALKAIEAERPHMILTDFHMPDVDGLELAGMISDVSKRIDIYMMSTSDTDHLERSAAFVGISGFLKKPFTAEDIDCIMHKRLGLDKPKFGKTRPMFAFLERPIESDQVFL